MGITGRKTGHPPGSWSTSRGHGSRRAQRSWPQRISDNLAYGLLVYTALQIFVTMKQLKELSHSLLPYLALAVLVAAIIPAARAVERKWVAMGADEAFDPAHEGRFRRDRLIIWLTVIGTPFLLAAIARCIALANG